MNKMKDVEPILSRATEEVRSLLTFVEICRLGLNQGTKAEVFLSTRIEVAEILEEPPPFRDEAHLNEMKEHARTISEFARSQFDRGQPYLHGLAVVRLWSILETTVDDLAARWLLNPATCKDQGLLQKLKGPLIEFAEATPDRRSEYLLDSVKSATQASLKLGSGRFESILEPLGLGGEVTPNVRRCVLELQQVRNLVAHRSGIVDVRFLRQCPWAGGTAGKEFAITEKVFDRYINAAIWYTAALKARVRSLSGGSSERLNAVLGRIEEYLGKSYIQDGVDLEVPVQS